VNLASCVIYFSRFQEVKVKDETEPKYNANFNLLKADGVVIGINFPEDLLQAT
jgi:hypothetical protein